MFATFATGEEDMLASILPPLTHLTAGLGLPITPHSRLMFIPSDSVSVDVGYNDLS